MKYQASEAYDFPPGIRWAVGEVRDITVPEGADLPAWLTPYKPAKAKAKAKAKQPADDPAEADRG